MTKPNSVDSAPLHPIVPRSILAWLCHYANADPSFSSRYFYDLKDRLLRQFAEFRGHDIQEITKKCWGDKRDDYGDWHGCGPRCRRCGGTGVWDRRWVRLQKYAMWARMTFSWKRCWCGKLFPTWGTGWQICKKCRKPKTVSDQDEVPF